MRVKTSADGFHLISSRSAALSTSSTSSAAQTRQRCCFFLSLLFNPSCSGFSTLVICIIFTEQNAPKDDEKLKEEGNQSKKESSVIERERKPETQYHGMAGETSRGSFFSDEKEK